MLAVASIEASASAPGLSPDDARERITALRAEIAHHDELYFKKSAPEISDAAYDALKRELRALEQAFPELAATVSPPADRATGDDRTGLFPTAVHRVPMLSLDKTYDEAELRAFLAGLSKQLVRDDLAFVVEPKVDGLAVSVTYEHGRLVRAVTRGNGATGDDITANVLTIPNLPRELRAPPVPDLIELRGELFFTFAEFERINRERDAAGEPPFANPRNLAAGTAKLLDPVLVAERNLSIVFFGWGACEPTSAAPESQSAFHQRLRTWGLPALAHAWTARGADDVWTAVRALERMRRTLAFPIDGAVVKLDSAALQRQLGASGQAPRWAVACKFAPDRAETRLLGITIQVGRTGLLTPVAEFEPVQLAGTTVARASLHNRDIIARRDIRLGDFVHVEKAGDIIPEIVGVNLARRPAGAEPYSFPTACPACGTAVEPVAGGGAVRCPGASCPAQLRRRIEHFASEACLEIAGLGENTVDALVSAGSLANVADIYHLRREHLALPARTMDVSADILLAAIERSKRAELWRFIHGLGISQVGPATARKLASTFDSLESLAAATSADFAPGGRAGRVGLGEATTQAILVHFAAPENRAIVSALLAAGVQPHAPDAPGATGALAGRILVLTGTLPTLERDEATRRIEAAGGVVRSAVSGQTHYVVAGREPGSKLVRARELGVPVIDEAELLRMLAGE